MASDVLGKAEAPGSEATSSSFSLASARTATRPSPCSFTVNHAKFFLPTTKPRWGGCRSSAVASGSVRQMVVKRVSSAASLMYTSCWTVNLETEREPKWRAHQRWNVELPRERFERGPTREIAQEAVHIESRMQLLFSFEKMAIRDAVRDPKGARLFAECLYDWLYGPRRPSEKFMRWCDVIASLPAVRHGSAHGRSPSRGSRAARVRQPAAVTAPERGQSVCRGAAASALM
jgi:hypothetical protein